MNEIIAKAKNFCAYSERSRMDVVRKLFAWKVPEELHHNIIDALYAEKYLSDDRFAQLFVQSKINQKKWGKVKIMTELYRHGFSEEETEKYFSIAETEKMSSNLDFLIEKKMEENHGKTDQQFIEKLKKYLYSKGYEIEMIVQKLKY